MNNVVEHSTAAAPAFAQAERRSPLSQAGRSGLADRSWGFVLAVMRALGLIVTTLAFAIAIRFAASEEARASLKRRYAQSFAALIGAKVVVEGEPYRGAPTIYAPNHISWIDSIALSPLCEARFVAKREIASWPVIGRVIAACDVLFVERHWRRAKEQAREIAAGLRRGANFVLYPEGTSTIGLELQPYKSSLFWAGEPSAGVGRLIAVQPVTLSMTRDSRGRALSREELELFAWIGDASFAPHLWRCLRSPGPEIRIIFHEPILCWPGAARCRKAVAREARATSASALPFRSVHRTAPGAF